MSDTENKKFILSKVLEYRNRHHNHIEGETLYYHCKYTDNWREGVVKNVIPHYGMVYYVLEVDTGPPINESFLRLVSEFGIKTGDEI